MGAGLLSTAKMPRLNWNHILHAGSYVTVRRTPA
ncbi:hypothetical protein scyTo_0025947, partial [Scyliorhinus torazame]|nr:hypothetical protein [Scyliorhinus torazame]